MFVRSGTGWSQEAKLTASDATAGDIFGASVAISGSSALVGAPDKNSATGAAYVFVLPSQKAKLAASDAAESDRFGFSVAISGSTAVVGSLGSRDYTGAAYVFVRSGGSWSQQAELTPSDGAAHDAFGSAVAISGSTVVVGAPDKNSYAGAVYVFARSGSSWSQQAELTGSAAGDRFGYAVAISGSTALVGAYGAGAFTGAAYVFVHTTKGGASACHSRAAAPS